jgi:Bacterial regulatory proteins, gntR family
MWPVSQMPGSWSGRMSIPGRAARRSLTCVWPWGLAGVSPDDYDANVRSTKPTVAIDHSSPALLHEQVAAAIRRAIADGEAGPGERLPPARDLAAVLGVDANTVFRALRTLREEGRWSSAAAAGCR